VFDADNGPSDSASRADLLDLVALGSQSAFRDLYDELSQLTFLICSKFSSIDREIDEAMEEVWLFIWTHALELSARAESSEHVVSLVALRIASARASARPSVA